MKLILFLVSAYVARPGSLFADGGRAIWSPKQCVVASTPHFKFGTTLYLKLDKKKYTPCLVRDRLGSPKHIYHLDWLVRDKKTALNFGVQKIEGYKYD